MDNSKENEYRQLLSSLQENNSIYSLENIPTGICIFSRHNNEDRCVAANSSCAAIRGIDVSSMIGQPPEFFAVHPDDEKRHKANLIDVLQKEGSISDIYRIYNNNEKQYNWVKVDGKLIKDQNGNLYAFFTYTNINALNNSEKFLDENWKAFYEMIQYIPGGVFVYSAEEDEQFSFVSENMLNMLGYTENEFKEKFNNRFSYMVYKDDREETLASIWEQIEKAPFDTVFYRIEKKDGSLLWVHDEGHIITDGNGKRWFYVIIVNITDAVNLRTDLKNENIKLSTLIDNIPASVLVYSFGKNTNDLKIVAANGYINDRIYELNSSLTKLTADEMRMLVHPEDKKKVFAFFRELSTGKVKSNNTTFRLSVDNGENYIWYNCNALSVPQEDGSVLVYTVYTDATLQKAKEDNFNRILQEFFAASPNSLFALRLNLTKNTMSEFHGDEIYTKFTRNITTADELFQTVYQAISNEAEKKKFSEMCSREALLRSAVEGKNTFSNTYKSLVGGGQVHWVTTNIHILQNPFTNDMEAFAYCRDCDLEKKREEIITAITETEYDCIGTVNVDTHKINYYYISKKNRDKKRILPDTFEKRAEYIYNNMPSDNDREIYKKNISLQKIIKALASNPTYTYDYTYISPEEGQRRKKVIFRYIDDDKSEIMFSYCDITDSFVLQEQQNNELRAALLNAEKANEMKTDFLGNVSHDMRTPLNAIIGYTQLARQSMDLNERNAFLDKISIASETLTSLINDTLDLQRIETGITELKKKPVSCDSVIKDIIASVQPLMEKKNIEFVIDNSRAVMATINVDIIRVREIFINLLSNAVKFTPEGGRVEMIIECVEFEPGYIHDRITVKDNGIGMSKDFLAKMYEPFSQERTKDTASIGGSGLGLTIVKRLVELMGGRIEVESELGKGSAFTVFLDFERVDGILPPDHSEKTVSDNISGIRALLCEDNAMNTEIAKRILELNGVTVDTAVNGEDGCNKFVSSTADFYDIILMDIRMPVMDGYTAAKNIRASNHPRAKRIPILAMSADAYEEDIKKTLASGMNGHIAKPIDPRKMISEISRLCGK